MWLFCSTILASAIDFLCILLSWFMTLSCFEAQNKFAAVKYEAVKQI